MTTEEMLASAARLRKDGLTLEVELRSDAKFRDDLLLAADVLGRTADAIDWIEEAMPTRCHRATYEDLYPWLTILNKLRGKP